MPRRKRFFKKRRSTKTKLRFPLRRYLLLLAVGLFMAAVLPSCAHNPPKNVNNVCDIFQDRRAWYKAAKQTYKRWGVPVYVTMAFIHQESGFAGKAKPPRKKILGFIPGPRPSNAFGYAQALKGTWKEYQVETGNGWSDRDSFADAVDFIGWYNHRSYKRNGIARDNAYGLYLAYHEGHGGYARGTYKKKTWLINVSKKVQRQSNRYKEQYWSCHKELDKNWLQRLFS